MSNPIRKAGYFAGESILIILSILLAFMANEWRQDAANKRNAAEAMDYFRVEIEKNLDILDRVIPYHEQVVANFQALNPEQLTGRTPVQVLMGGGVMPRGISPPLVSSSAWDTALARNALAHFEFETVYSLSRLYDMQESGVENTWRLLAGQFIQEKLFDPERTAMVVPTLGFAFQELLSQEKTLANEYRAMLEKLDAS